MIRINLSGSPRSKKGKRGGGGGGGEAEAGGGPGAVVFLVVGLVVGLGVSGFFYKRESDREAKVTKQIADLKAEAATLSQAKERYAQLEKEKTELDNNKKAIDELVANHIGPVKLMDTLGSTVNGVEAVWLDNMSDNGANVTLNGNALTTTAVANFMTKLKASGYFKNVDIKDASEAQLRDLKIFKFSLTCDKAPPDKPATPGAPGAPAANPPAAAPAKS